VRVDDHTSATIVERERARALLIAELHDNEGAKNPAIEIASPQMSQGSGRHRTMKRA
jgi:hypothetical protein